MRRNLTPAQSFERSAEMAGLAAELQSMMPKKCPTCGQEVEEK